jgi:hypothetical protein
MDLEDKRPDFDDHLHLKYDRPVKSWRALGFRWDGFSGEMVPVLLSAFGKKWKINRGFDS